MKKRIAVLFLLAALLISGCAKQEHAEVLTDLQVSLEDGTAVLSWTAEGHHQFRVYRRTSEEQDFRFQDDVTVGSYTDRFIEAGTVYEYKVIAFSGSRELGSARAELAVPAAAPQLHRPAAPVITSVTQMPDNVVVIQLDKQESAEEYRFFRADSLTGHFVQVGTSREPVFYDSTADPLQSWYYKAQRVTAGLSSDESLPVMTGTNAQPVFGVPVLMYHEFVTQADLADGVLFDEYAIWKDDFEADLIWLRDNGYTTITTADLLRYMRGEAQPPEKPVILTIDDGKWGVYRNAFPLLQQYNMKAVLSVIGKDVSRADPDPEVRRHEEAPFCTWEEIREMSDSGHVEIISHTFDMHIYNYEDHPGRTGADCGPEDTYEDYFAFAFGDYLRMKDIFETDLGISLLAQSYPYSKRSMTADQVWLDCGYQILYSGNSSQDRPSRTNFYTIGAGVNIWSAVTRRVARMDGTPVSEYLS